MGDAEKERAELARLRERCARQRELIRALQSQVRQLEAANERIICAQESMNQILRGKW